MVLFLLSIHVRRFLSISTLLQLGYVECSVSTVPVLFVCDLGNDWLSLLFAQMLDCLSQAQRLVCTNPVFVSLIMTGSLVCVYSNNAVVVRSRSCFSLMYVPGCRAFIAMNWFRVTCPLPCSPMSKHPAVTPRCVRINWISWSKLLCPLCALIVQASLVPIVHVVLVLVER